MNKTRILCAVCAAALTLALSGCKSETGGGSSETSGSTNSTTEEVLEMNIEREYAASGENVKLLGRTYFDGGRLYCALSGTGAEFTFRGTKCAITVIGDSNSTKPDMADNHARVGIYVNGERVTDDMVDNAEEVYDVFESETPQDVTITVVKLSESPMSTIAISSIKVTGGEIKPTADKDLFIEFVGDSITCGYGVDDPDKSHPFSTKTEDVTKAYAYKTAAALGADYSMVSFSGYGIISGYSDGKKKVSAQRVPLYYTKLGYSWSNNGEFAPSNIDWDFSGRQPDVVVINLGTNDDSYTLNDEEKKLEYSAAYTEFLKTVREKNPGAKIVCAFGVMGDRLFDYVQLAVDNFVEQTGDENISTLHFDVQDPADGYSADWHPSLTTHDKASAKLVEKIRSILE